MAHRLTIGFNLEIRWVSLAIFGTEDVFDWTLVVFELPAVCVYPFNPTYENPIFIFNLEIRWVSLAIFGMESVFDWTLVVFESLPVWNGPFNPTYD